MKLISNESLAQVLSNIDEVLSDKADTNSVYSTSFIDDIVNSRNEFKYAYGFINNYTNRTASLLKIVPRVGMIDDINLDILIYGRATTTTSFKKRFYTTLLHSDLASIVYNISDPYHISSTSDSMTLCVAKSQTYDDDKSAYLYLSSALFKNNYTPLYVFIKGNSSCNVERVTDRPTLGTLVASVSL